MKEVGNTIARMWVKQAVSGLCYTTVMRADGSSGPIMCKYCRGEKMVRYTTGLDRKPYKDLLPCATCRRDDFYSAIRSITTPLYDPVRP